MNLARSGRPVADVEKAIAEPRRASDSRRSIMGAHVCFTAAGGLRVWP
jgi:hypothetical protein